MRSGVAASGARRKRTGRRPAWHLPLLVAGSLLPLLGLAVWAQQRSGETAADDPQLRALQTACEVQLHAPAVADAAVPARPDGPPAAAPRRRIADYADAAHHPAARDPCSEYFRRQNQKPR